MNAVEKARSWFNKVLLIITLVVGSSLILLVTGSFALGAWIF